MHLTGVDHGADGDHLVLEDTVNIEQLSQALQIKVCKLGLQIGNQLLEFDRIFSDQVDQSCSVGFGNTVKNEFFLRYTRILRCQIPALDQHKRVDAVLDPFRIFQQGFQLCGFFRIRHHVVQQARNAVDITQQLLGAKLMQDLLDIENIEPLVARNDFKELLQRESRFELVDIHRYAVLEVGKQT